jgi:hypothetical protein
MHVRMKVDVSGTRDGRPWPRRGETFEVSDTEGADLCASGLATPVAKTEAAETEKAVPADSTQEQRTGLTTQNSGALTPTPADAGDADASGESGPANTDQDAAPAEPAKKAAAPRKTAAKRTAAKPSDSK